MSDLAAIVKSVANDMVHAGEKAGQAFIKHLRDIGSELRASSGLYRDTENGIKDSIGKIGHDVSGDAAHDAVALARDTRGVGAASDGQSLASEEEKALAAREKGADGATDDPVDVVTGEMFLPQEDLALPGVLPLVLGRRHGSAYAHGELFGTRWASTLDQHAVTGLHEIRVALEDGRVLHYPVPGDGDRVMPSHGPRWPLSWDRQSDAVTVEQGDLGQTLHFAARETFGPRRRLLSVTDRAGNEITFTYGDDGVINGLRHSGGYHVKVGTTVTLGGVRVSSLALADPDGGGDIPVREFRYSLSGHLTGVVNASGLPLLFEYDSEGRITRWEDRNGYEYRYTYREDGRVVRGEGTGGFLNVALDYDLDARTTTVTDALGHETVHHWNDRFQVVRVIDPLGHETRTEKDQYGNVLSVTDELGRTTRIDRNDFGDAVACGQPDGSVVTVTYDEDRSPVTVTGPDGSTWRYTYDENGLPAAVTDPAGSVTQVTRDDHGAPLEMADPLGAVTRFGCDQAGLLTQLTNPAGGVWQLQRDAFGRITAFTDPVGSVTRQQWDADGNLLARVHPDGTRENWEYDPEGNLTAYTSPTGVRTTCEYSGFDVPVRSVGPDGSAYEFTYDAQLRLVAVTNSDGLTWHYEYDPAGQLVSETDFNGATITYTHDAAGQLTSRTNAAGQRIEYQRDILGRVIERHSGQTVHRYEYDIAGQLMSAVSPDAELSYTRDPLGRVLTETVNGRTLSNTYDAAGNRTSRRTPSGILSRWTHDPAGQPIALNGTAGELSFAYDSAGREITRRLGPAATLTQGFDVLNRLTDQNIWAGDQHAAPSRSLQARTYAYRADGIPAEINDALRGRRTFSLDGAGRISAVTAANWSETYAYDSMGNLAQATGPAPESDTDGDREILGTRILRAGRTTYTFDEAGRVTRQRRRTLSGQVREWTYTWDADDHLVQATTPNGSTWRYLYDPLGRRIAKEQADAAGSTVTFAWDGPCLAEEERRGPDGAVIRTWDYLPDSFVPAAQTRRQWAATAPQDEIDAEFHSIVTDLAGAPSELVAQDGTIAWHSTRSTWGSIAATSDGTTCPLGFPGQYYDSETGLWYNLNRYYDPGTAAYLSSDPLGLAPAPNPHAYVPNPLLDSDPLGLQNCASEDPTWGGRVKFGQPDALGRPTGIKATLEQDMMGKGTEAAKSIRPPGFLGGRPLGPDARGHLLGKQLGGSGDVKENLVSLYQNPANTPKMRGFENQVRKAVDGGQTVHYEVTPIYHGSQLRPKAVTMEAHGSGGFHLRVTVLNKKPGYKWP